jgi:hypothetical protein
MLNIGRKGRVFAKLEAVYGTNPTIAAANAVRHVNIGITFDPYQRETSPEKKESPGPVNRFDRRVAANLSPFEALIRPSGTINTVPEIDPFLEAAFGAKTNVVLATTINDAAATTTSATLTSVVGLAKGGALLFVIGTKKYARYIAGVAGSVVTWAPALPSAPANGSAVKSALIYKLSTDNAKSIYIGHYLDGFARNLSGVGIADFTLNFAGTEEARFTGSGPGRTQVSTGDAGIAAEPGTFTEVGGNPPTGMAGELRIGDIAYLHKSLSLQCSTGVVTRNEEAGNDGLATEVYRAGRRETTVTLECYVETPGTLYDFAKVGTNKSLFRQNGWTEGNILALYAPRVEFKPATTDDPDEATSWSFEGTPLETADGENDEFFLILA